MTRPTPQQTLVKLKLYASTDSIMEQNLKIIDAAVESGMYFDPFDDSIIENAKFNSGWVPGGEPYEYLVNFEPGDLSGDVDKLQTLATIFLLEETDLLHPYTTDKGVTTAREGNDGARGALAVPDDDASVPDDETVPDDERLPERDDDGTWIELCIDCGSWIANGEEPTDDDTAWSPDQIDDNWNGYHLAVCCPPDDDGEPVEDCECIEFTWSSCDGCGSQLGGSRYHGYAWPEQTVDSKFLKLANERFAWPGGYEIFFVTDDSGLLCSPCVVREWNGTIRSTHNGSGWFIEGFSHTGEDDGRIQCDHCNYLIQESWLDDEDDEDEHVVHTFGPFERSRFAGTLHRKCTYPFCDVISLDSDDGE